VKKLITLIKLFSKLDRFKLLSRINIGKNLVEALNSTLENALDPNEAVSGIVIFSLFLGVGISVLSFLCLNNVFVSIMVGVIAFYLTGTYVLKQLTQSHLKKLSALYKYSDLAIEDFLTAYNSTGSIFDAIKFVSEGNYPYISEEFRKIIYKINCGYPPEDLLRDFAITQPSETLKSFILTMLDLRADLNAIQKIVELNRMQIQMEYQKFTMQIESRIMIAVGLTVFLPLIFGLTSIIWGIGDTPLILILIPLQVILMWVLTRGLVKSKLTILGEGGSTNA